MQMNADKAKSDAYSRSSATDLLIRPHAPVGPGIFARFNYAPRSNPHQSRRRTTLPARAGSNLVPAIRQILNYVLRRAVVKLQIARVHGVIVEARNQVPRFEPRRLDRLLGVLAEEDHVEKNLHERLFLVIAARS